MADVNIDQFNRDLETLAASLVGVSGAFNSVLASLQGSSTGLNSFSSATRNATNANQAAAQGAQSAAASLSRFGFISTSLISNLTSLASATTSVTTSVYSATEAFTAVAPAIDKMVSFTSKMIEALGAATSGITLFGFSLGSAPAGVAKFVTTGLELANSVIKTQLELSQSVQNTFVGISKTGINFGNSIDAMARAAADSGMTISDFAKLIQRNGAEFSKLGGAISDNVVKLGQMSSNIGRNNRGLLASYGSFSALSEGVAEYIGLQTQLGLKDLNNVDQLTAGAEQYLIRQRELTRLTGKQAEQLKNEQAARNAELAYGLKKSRLSSDEAKQNLEEVMSLAGRVAPEMTQYLKEYFASDGKYLSAEMRQFGAVNQAAIQPFLEMLAAVNQTKDGFRSAAGVIMTEAAPRLEAFAKGTEQLAEVNYAANNKIIDMQVRTASGIMANMGMLSNSGKMFEQIAKEAQAGPGKSTEISANAIMQLTSQQREIDRIAVESMTRMEKFLEFGHRLNMQFISQGERVMGVVDAMASPGGTIDKLRVAVERFLQTSGITPPTSEQRLLEQQNWSGAAPQGGRGMGGRTGRRPVTSPPIQLPTPTSPPAEQPPAPAAPPPAEQAPTSAVQPSAAETGAREVRTASGPEQDLARTLTTLVTQNENMYDINRRQLDILERISINTA